MIRNRVREALFYPDLELEMTLRRRLQQAQRAGRNLTEALRQEAEDKKMAANPLVQTTLS